MLLDSVIADSQIPAYDHGIFRASSDFDLTHRVVFSGGWDLPFDQAWADGPRRLTKGWSLYPIFSWRTGFPLTISSQYVDSFDPSDPGPSGAGDSNLANAIFAPGYSGITIMNPKTSGNLYFNPAAFTQIPDIPGSGYGLPRNFFRGPHRTNLDMALAKSTPIIAENLNAELRVDAFNLLNEVEFANPDTNIFTTQTFGQSRTRTLSQPLRSATTPSASSRSLSASPSNRSCSADTLVRAASVPELQVLEKIPTKQKAPPKAGLLFRTSRMSNHKPQITNQLTQSALRPAGSRQSPQRTPALPPAE